MAEIRLKIEGSASAMRGRLALAFAVAFGLVACGTPAPSASTTCTPGVQIACACSGGAKGVQICLPSGKGFGECGQCGFADASTAADVPGQDADSVAADGDAKFSDEVGDAIGSDTVGQDAVVDVEAALDVGAGLDVDAGPDTGVPLTCINGFQDGLETDVDCGGQQCPACSPNKACAIGTDCKSAICLNKVCQAPLACTNGKKDELETDIDCGGGACKPCTGGKSCVVQDDCADKSCVNGTCSDGTSCTDGKLNSAETDVDCGGPLCKKCSDGSKCLVAGDCGSAACNGKVCGIGAGCTDGTKDGKETDSDCGGDTCKACESGKLCNTGTDCTSFLCVNTVCTAPSCSDQVQNGLETDIDCGGGGACVPCDVAQKCKDAPDCLTQLCFNGLCKVQPTCTDSMKNGTETDKDCGGANCPACVAGKTCLAAKDCVSAVCKNSVCQVESCTDKTMNGTEADVDCGGANCPKCSTGEGCSATGDCAGNGAKCQAPLCAASKCTTAPLNCADSVPCTNDTCDDAIGCVHTAVNSACDDGIACTTDSCEVWWGCNHIAISSACDDGVDCTTDACSAGSGCSHVPVPSACDDGNPCTNDLCMSSGPAAGCNHSNSAVGTPCGGLVTCNGAGKCPTEGMVLIPGGTFWMGCNVTKDSNCNADEKPQHMVTLSAYYMDLTETTVAQYKACVNAGGCTVPSSVQPTAYATYPGLANNPVNFVSWMQSQQYCKWRGKAFDLPTEAQWEMAARGSCEQNGSTSGDPGCAAAMRTYPWGETTPTTSYAVFNVFSSPAAVGSTPAGDSPYGLHDIAGNVWEWNRDWYGSYGSGAVTDPVGPSNASSRVIRGGCYYNSAVYLRAGDRSYDGASGAFKYLGLRCARSYP